MRLILRVFADSPEGESVQALASALQNALAAFNGRLEGAPERYWKIPQWLEFTFCLAPATAEQFEAFLAAHPSGWRHDGEELERSSVWNPPSGQDKASGPGSPTARPPSWNFLHPRLRWAELILTPSGPAPDNPADLPASPH